MPEGKEKHCRLCLKVLENDYNLIEQINREIFEVLLIKVNLSVSKEPLMCKSCEESIQEAFNFKSACVSVDEQVVSFTIDKNSAELNIRDVYLNENKNKSLDFNEDYNICRFCLQCLEGSNFNLLSDLRKNGADEMLLKCIPELDLNIIKEPVVCAACMKCLESYYNFAMKCQNTEENIMKYCELQRTKSRQINLSSVLKFVFKSMPQSIGNCSKAAAITKGDNFSQNKDEEIEELIQEETSAIIYKCKLCSYQSKLKIELRTHILAHKDSSDAVIYKCDKCTFKTKYKSNIRQHVLIHIDNSKATMYKCNLCKYQTKFKRSLKTHMITHKDPSDLVMYRCEKCTFEAKIKHNLLKHMRIHRDNSELTMHKCNLCSYETKWAYNLKYHMVKHKDPSDVVMFRCALCPFKTKRKLALTSHTLVHRNNSNLTMYKCNSCSYETKWKSSLTMHVLTHKNSSDMVMYKCEKCPYEGKRKTSLKLHMLIHKDNSEVTMHKCHLCTYESKWKNNLTNHLITHKDSSEAVMYRCTNASCIFETKYKHNFKTHMRICLR